jgi:metaxin
MKLGNKTVSRSVEDIIAAVKQAGFNLDRSLGDAAVTETAAYSALLTHRLLPAMMYSQWMDTQSYMEVTSRRYGKMMSFPLSSLFLSWKYRTTQRDLMRGVPPDTTLEQLGIELQARAEEGINLLSSRLAERQFFNGESPSSLDALVFGYLEVMLQTPLPSSNLLYLHLHSCSNLLHFCSRVRAKAFPDKKLRVMSVVTGKPSAPLWRDPKVWLSVGVAGLLLGVQAARVGLLARLASFLLSRRNLPLTN